MNLLIALFRWVLNLIYFFRKKRVKRRHCISFISRQDNKPSLDFIMLARELKRQDAELEVNVYCRKIDPGILGKFRYLIYMMGTMLTVFARSEVIILDGYCIVASLLKRQKSPYIIQMWHAMGAFKKFGYAVAGEKEGYSTSLIEAMRMHRNYDYIFISSRECIESMSRAYDCSHDVFKVMPLPRTDFIREPEYFHKVSKEIRQRYPNIDIEKNTILYAPTFRKGSDNISFVNGIVEKVDYSRYNLVIKPHPLMKKFHCKEPVIVDYDFSSVEMLSVADCVITDYSAFILEAALANLPIFRYVPDFDDYSIARGFFIDAVNEFPGFMSKNPDEIIKAIETNRYDFAEIENFSNKYVEFNETCTQKMAKFILALLF